jgi:anti-sigma regulatory factor (Ser/Thr protein kinase)
VRLDVRHDTQANEAVVTVADSGAPFDPLVVSTGSRPRILAEARPGGLGLTMIRGFADILSYRYLDERNQLSFGVRWSARADD